jgi:hypothetical protein
MLAMREALSTDQRFLLLESKEEILVLEVQALQTFQTSAPL